MFENNLVGTAREKRENYDLINVVMVYLGQAESKTESDTLKLLNTLFCSEVSAADKLDFLENEFGIMRSRFRSWSLFPLGRYLILTG